MRIARVIARVELGGTQLGALRLTQALRSRGVETTILAGHASPQCLALFASAGVKVEVWHGADGDMQYACSRPFAEWLRPRIADADLVHGHMFGGWWAASEAAAPGQPVVASEHNALQWPRGPRIGEMRRALRGVDAFFAHGPATRATLRGLGFPPDRLYPGRSPIEWPGRSNRISPELDELPRPRVLFAGRLHREKGPDLLLEAVARVPSPPACVLLGTGPEEGALRRLARQLGIEELVQLPGWRRRIGPWLAGADMLVVPSRYESWSQAAVTAMAHRVPVVATNVEGLPLTLAEGRGVLVPPEDPEALAHAITDVLAGLRAPNLAAANSYAARHTAPKVARYYLGVYRGLLDRGRRATTLAGTGAAPRRTAA